MPQQRLHEIGQDPDPRFTFANERTFLAWNRTALALIGGGLAAGQLLEFDTRAVRLIVGLVPILLGAVLAAGSYRRWEANERALRLGQPLPSGAPPRWLAFAVVVLAVGLGALLVIDAY
jgi:putative membrane protein